jgi:hypothetical protein
VELTEPTDVQSQDGQGQDDDPPLAEGPDAILDLVNARRAALRDRFALPEGAEKIWGLALSGGGIRSATFCFGLLRALADKGSLLRFDLLSTVSGGGYIGAMLGRLFSHAANATDVLRVQDELGDNRIRWFQWWLRANGRYLVPAGAKDTALACSLYLRNFLGVHFELGLIALALGLVLAGFDLCLWWAAHALALYEGAYFFNAARVLSPWVPTFWVLLVIPAIVGAVQVAAFWDIAWLGQTTGTRKLLLWLLGLAFAVGFGIEGYSVLHTGEGFGGTLRKGLWVAVMGLMAIWLMGVPVAQFRYRAKIPPGGVPPDDFARNRLTTALSRTFIVALFILLAGVADRAAWFLAFEQMDLVRPGVTLFVAAAVARTLLPLIAKVVPGGPDGLGSGAVLVVSRVLGYALTFLLCVWWISLVHRAVLGGIFRIQPLDFGYGRQVLMLIALPVLGYLALTGYNVAFLNLSSLHGFYRARLSRSYLGAANGNRFSAVPANALGALERVPSTVPPADAKRSVSEVVRDDDVSLSRYRPFKHGGPVHLINVCINESKDPRGGQFNKDRRGQVLTVVSGGLNRISLEDWTRLPPHSPLTLASWTAISGAAFAPGLGSMTRGGISALATFAGIRTGFWWDRATRAGLPRTPWRLSFEKSRGILRETFGKFSASEGDDWFLSDGGHFENTGAYALLSQRAEVIVVADCGADPGYRFEDLENLVRKARIDMGAKIVFQRPLKQGERDAFTLRPPDDLLAVFGSVNDLASANSTACLALATIEYPDRPDQRSILIVVKPNVCLGLPVDLVNFKAKHPDFPQQTTLDQFFSEAQWESYHQLGRQLGKHLTASFVADLLAHSGTWFVEDDGSPHGSEKAQAKPAGTQTATAPIAAAANAASSKEPAAEGPGTRLPARISATTATVGATLSLGAAATLGVGVWQAIDAARTAYSKQVAAERDALQDLVDKWAKTEQMKKSYDDNEVRAISGLAATLLHHADTLCPANEAGWISKSQLATTVVNDTLKKCRALLDEKVSSGACSQLLDLQTKPTGELLIPWCLVPPAESANDTREPTPLYWGYAYTLDAKFRDMHPCDPLPVQYGQQGWANRTDGTAACKDDGVGDVLTAGWDWLRTFKLPTSMEGAWELIQTALSRLPGLTTALVRVPGHADRPGITVPSDTGAARPSPSPGIPGECNGKTIYVQTYGPEQRDRLSQELRGPWQLLQASVPPIEDVWASAKAKGRPEPSPVKGPTIRTHDPISEVKACTDAMLRALPTAVTKGWKVEQLSPRFKPTRGVIEVWLPPPDRPS